MRSKKTEDFAATTELANKKSKWKLLGKQKGLLLMSVPFVLYIIVFRYIPLLGWTMAFQDYKPSSGFFDQTWVGLKWFKELFKSTDYVNGGTTLNVGGLRSSLNTGGVCFSIIIRV